MNLLYQRYCSNVWLVNWLYEFIPKYVYARKKYFVKFVKNFKISARISRGSSSEIFCLWLCNRFYWQLRLFLTEDFFCHQIKLHLPLLTWFYLSLMLTWSCYLIMNLSKKYSNVIMSHLYVHSEIIIHQTSKSWPEKCIWYFRFHRSSKIRIFKNFWVFSRESDSTFTNVRPSVS